MTLSNISGGAPTGASAAGQTAVARSSQRLSADAQSLASPSGASSDAALLDSSQTLLLAEAGAAVIKTADKMLGTLLDAFA
jgi:hypothetical protein